MPIGVIGCISVFMNIVITADSRRQGQRGGNSEGQSPCKMAENLKGDPLAMQTFMIDCTANKDN